MTQMAERQNTSGTSVFCEVSGHVGWVTLDRQDALNSLNHEMVQTIHGALQAWETDETVQAIVVQGKGRAFCAGGDVRDFYHKKKRGEVEGSLTFFHDEYQLNRYIKRYPKPYISLINGINMGGGLGISAHGSHRVVTEKARLAMPETTIGFFPDVGGTYFLSRMSDNMGLYLGLTGDHMNAEDAHLVGLATHYVLSESLPNLIEDLRQADLSEGEGEQITTLIESHQTPVPQSQYLDHMPLINKAFAFDSIEDILLSLQEEGSAFSQKTLETLGAKSPTSLKVFLKAMKQCGDMDFEACMDQEWQMAQNFVRNHDFAEGIRALLIDKDKNPQWQPSRLDQVSDQDVNSYF